MICAIVLAAGRSQRMGTQKLLLPLAGKPMIARIVDELQQSPVQQTFVVVGAKGEEIQLALDSRTVTFTKNPNSAGDMLSSIRCGLRAMPSTCTAVLIVLGDQPNLTSQLVAKLAAAFEKSGRGLIVPTHQGHRGHPVIIAARFRDELLTRHDDVGLLGLLDAHPEELFQLEITDGATLQDLDTPEDYQRHLSSNAG